MLRYLTAIIVVLASVGLMACGQGAGAGDPPVLDKLSDKTALVGQQITLVVKALDPDGDEVNFFISGRPERATFVALDDGQTAVFQWTPEIRDADVGGREYPLKFIAKDSTGQWDSVEITVTVYPAWAPTFINPSGYVLNLAVNKELEFMVEVKDDGASRIDIGMDDFPEGAYLEQQDKKAAYFYWKPTEEQIRDRAYWYVIFTGEGFAKENNQEVSLYTVEQVVSIVLTNREEGGCQGGPPVVEVSPLGDIHGGDSYTITARITDSDSYVEAASLFWATGAPDSPTGFKVVPMLSEANSMFTAQIPAAVEAADGTWIHYYIEAWDNDDWAGSQCDNKARYPKQTNASFVVYGEGFEDACLDDELEPNLSLDTARWLEPGSWTHLRLCTDDEDWFLMSRDIYDVAVTLTTQDSDSDLMLQPGDVLGNPTGNPVEAGRTVIVAPGDPQVDVVSFRVWSPMDRVATYGLEIKSIDEICEQDQFEPNNNSLLATGVHEGEYRGLVICPGEEDWFRITVIEPVYLDVMVEFSNEKGDLDVQLLTGNGLTLIKTEESETDNERLQANLSVPGDYYLRIYGYQGAMNNYNLKMETGEQGDSCLEDRMFPNQYYGDAVTVPINRYEDLTICPGKEDWFRVGLNQGDTLTVEVIPEDETPFRIVVHDLDTLEELAGSTINGYTATMEYTATEGKDYFFKIYNDRNVALSYILDVFVWPPDGEECTEDRFEPNDEPLYSTLLFEGATTQMRACGESVDWYSISVNGAQSFYVGMLYFSQQGPLVIELYDETGQILLAEGVLDSGVQSVSWQSQQTTDYLVKVIGDQDSRNSYDLLFYTD